MYFPFKKLLVAKLSILIVFSVFFTVPKVSHGAATTPFGGKIVAIIDCNCSNSTLLSIFDIRTKSTLMLVFMHGISRLNLNRNISMLGIWTLGDFTSGGICLVISGESCSEIPSNGMITPPPMAGIGTGLIPSF